MLLLITVLALARISVAATTPPGTGYSDADSCPPPETTSFGAVTTHSCSFCASTLTKAPLINKDAAWQSVAFANHATETARLVEVDAAGRELPRESNIAGTYENLGRLEDALQRKRDVYSGWLKLNGEEHESTLQAADNYALSLLDLERFKEAKKVLRKVIPVATRVLGIEHDLTLCIREDLCRASLDGDSSVKEKRKALRTLEDTVGIMRRVLGPQHPTTQRVQESLYRYQEES